MMKSNVFWILLRWYKCPTFMVCGELGIRLHFLLRRELWFRCRPAVGDQAATGSLDSIFESLLEAKNKTTHRVVLFWLLVYTLDVTFLAQEKAVMLQKLRIIRSQVSTQV